jgi:HlyD family secretion protein
VIQNVVTYDAVVEVANPDLRLKPGMTANLEVVYADRADALRVTNAALRFHPRPDQIGGTPPPVPPLGQRLVWVERGARLAPVRFTPGVSDGTWTEVTAGALAAGDRAVTEALDRGP